MCPYFEQWYVYDIYDTKYKYFHSLNQWYIYDIYGTIFPWNNDMYISMEQICPYLKNDMYRYMVFMEQICSYLEQLYGFVFT